MLSVCCLSFRTADPYFSPSWLLVCGYQIHILPFSFSSCFFPLSIFIGCTPISTSSIASFYYSTSSLQPSSHFSNYLFFSSTTAYNHSLYSPNYDNDIGSMSCGNADSSSMYLISSFIIILCTFQYCAYSSSSCSCDFSVHHTINCVLLTGFTG